MAAKPLKPDELADWRKNIQNANSIQQLQSLFQNLSWPDGVPSFEARPASVIGSADFLRDTERLRLVSEYCLKLCSLLEDFQKDSFSKNE